MVRILATFIVSCCINMYYIVAVDRLFRFSTVQLLHYSLGYNRLDVAVMPGR